MNLSFESSNAPRPPKPRRAAPPALPAAPAAPAEPTPAHHMVDRGWVPVERGEQRTHWAETKKGKTVIACGKRVPKDRRGEIVTVVSDDPRDLLAAGRCPACVTQLVREHHRVPFQVGDTVMSRACGMTLYGRIVSMFETHDREALLNLDRIWLKDPELMPQRPRRPGDWSIPSEPDTDPHHWYRLASECRPWTPGQSNRQVRIDADPLFPT